jgi:hypothetical protein
LSALFQRRSFALGHLSREFRRQSGDRHQLVGLQILLAIAILERNVGQTRSLNTKGQALLACHVIDDFEVQFSRLRFRSFGVIDLVADPRFASFLQL